MNTHPADSARGTDRSAIPLGQLREGFDNAHRKKRHRQTAIDAVAHGA